VSERRGGWNASATAPARPPSTDSQGDGRREGARGGGGAQSGVSGPAGGQRSGKVVSLAEVRDAAAARTRVVDAGASSVVCEARTPTVTVVAEERGPWDVSPLGRAVDELARVDLEGLDAPGLERLLSDVRPLSELDLKVAFADQ
jgi:hypothetical protein